MSSEFIYVVACVKISSLLKDELYCSVCMYHVLFIVLQWTFVLLVAQMVKNLPVIQETWVQFLGWEDPLEECMATHFSILAWRIRWTEESGKLQSMGLQRVAVHGVANDWAIKHIFWLLWIIVLWILLYKYLQIGGFMLCKTYLNKIILNIKLFFSKFKKPINNRYCYNCRW